MFKVLIYGTYELHLFTRNYILFYTGSGYYIRDDGMCYYAVDSLNSFTPMVGRDPQY